MSPGTKVEVVGLSLWRRRLWGDLITTSYYLQNKDGAKLLMIVADDGAGAMATNSSLGASGQAAGQTI